MANSTYTYLYKLS